jgi:hypothetical protein
LHCYCVYLSEIKIIKFFLCKYFRSGYTQLLTEFLVKIVDRLRLIGLFGR